MNASAAKAETHPLDSGTGFYRGIGRADGVALVVGTVIGSGIFLVPGAIAMQLSSLKSVLLVWVVGGLLSMSGALSLGELGAMYPGAGGLYVYLRQAFGRPLAFLYGWGLLSIIQTGSIATLAAGFSLYLSRLLPISQTEQKVAGIVCIAALSALNCFGLQLGKLVQNISTVAKLGGIVALFTLLVWRGHVHLLRINFTPAPPSLHGLVPFGAALIAVLWAYEGWHAVSFAASEFKNPRRDLPASLVIGTLACLLIYVLLNIAYYAVLPYAAIRTSDHAAASAMQAVYSPGTVAFVSVLIITSILGAMNGLILTGPRVYHAMGADGTFFRFLGNTNRHFRTPVAATLLQGVWASVLTLLGSFQQLFTYVVFTGWIFYGLTVAGVIVLRIRMPHAERLFRVTGYPWPPVLFIMAALAIVISTFLSAPLPACIGVGMILAGLPLYPIFRAIEKRATSSPEPANLSG